MTDLADEPSSLLEWATRLAVDPQLRARLAADPRGLLGEQGFAHVLPADLHHALPLVTDGVAARLGHDVDPALAGPVAAQYAGEHPLDALARQFTHVSDAVLAGPPPDASGHASEYASEYDVEHDLDDPVSLGTHDPTAFLDDLPGPHDPHGPETSDVAAHDPPEHPPAVAVLPAHDPGIGEPQPGPVVGNGDVAPDELDETYPAFPDHLDQPEHEHHEHPDAVHGPDVHPAHDVLDL